MRIKIGQQRTPEVEGRILSCGYGLSEDISAKKRIVGFSLRNRDGKYVRIELDPDEIDVLADARDKLRAWQSREEG